MEKTCNALIERLEKAYLWHLKCAEDMECQPDLNDDEKLYIANNRAITAKLKRILDVETQEVTT